MGGGTLREQIREINMSQFVNMLRKIFDRMDDDKSSLAHVYRVDFNILYFCIFSKNVKSNKQTQTKFPNG